MRGLSETFNTIKLAGKDICNKCDDGSRAKLNICRNSHATLEIETI